MLKVASGQYGVLVHRFVLVHGRVRTLLDEWCGLLDIEPHSQLGVFDGGSSVPRTTSGLAHRREAGYTLVGTHLVIGHPFLLVQHVGKSYPLRRTGGGPLPGRGVRSARFRQHGDGQLERRHVRRWRPVRAHILPGSGEDAQRTREISLVHDQHGGLRLVQGDRQRYELERAIGCDVRYADDGDGARTDCVYSIEQARSLLALLARVHGAGERLVRYNLHERRERRLL